MVIDCHVHVSAFLPGHGLTSLYLQDTIPFKFMRRRFGINGTDAEKERAVRDLLFRTLDQTPEIDKVMLLAFDAVYDRDGRADWDNTHLYVTNDYVLELSRLHPKIIFAASIHPYRKDAVAELERCAKAGAKMVKWLPITQNFNPADDRCVSFYEALAHLNIVLLSHTGAENALPKLDKSVADPMLLLEALRRGVKVIAAHCGSRLLPWEIDFVPNWARMAKDHEHFYGDTAALNVPNRWYAFDTILKDETLRKKLIHGSDWPILAAPPLHKIGWPESWDLLKEKNWMRRDLLIKRKLGFDDDYWTRGAKLLRLG